MFGTPIDERARGRDYPLPGLGSSHATVSGNGLLVSTRLRGHRQPGYLEFDGSGEIEPVSIEGIVHEGVGELEGLAHLEGDRYAARYNIDGCSWVYDTRFDEAAANADRRAGSRRRRRALGRHAARPSLRQGERRLRGVVLHGDRPDPAVAARAERRPAGPPDAGTRPRPRPRPSRPRARTRRSSRMTAFASRRASTGRLRSSATTGRDRSSTTCTAARRARSARTSRGSRCRSSRSSRSRASPSSSRTRAARPATGSTTRSASTATGEGSTAWTTCTR